jgi:uncharacterized RDD family membrane protein YckC
MRYAGFEKRLLANLIDVLVLLPLTLVLIVAYGQHRNLSLLVTVLGSLAELGVYHLLSCPLGSNLGQEGHEYSRCQSFG